MVPSLYYLIHLDKTVIAEVKVFELYRSQDDPSQISNLKISNLSGVSVIVLILFHPTDGISYNMIVRIEPRNMVKETNN